MAGGASPRPDRQRRIGPQRDAATRRRLVDSATRLFTERGFRKVTVREICDSARANLAAVNYHFGGKLGLYREVMDQALRGMAKGGVASLDGRLDPEERIRAFVSMVLHRLAEPGEAQPLLRLMRHEMREPTPLAPWIAERTILPQVRFLSRAVAEMLDCPPEDPRVRRCVLSIQAQCFHYQPSSFRQAAMPDWRPLAASEVAAVVEHVTAFSLAGIRAAAGVGGRRP